MSIKDTDLLCTYDSAGSNHQSADKDLKSSEGAARGISCFTAEKVG